MQEDDGTYFTFSFRFGFDKSCLLKSICELARHPLHEDDEEHLLVEVLNFMMT